ncbi:hypothetical protein VTN77DRAFT_23 [Rasamsonia byssochlamydoides]|uniref:uncharacterized protein n=1 Tax=Rasamsonia byssochlamydoides TaxID=89139 RepID=UPI003742ABC4
MALPLPPVLSPTECAQFGRSFAPYVFSPQLTSLPARIFEAGVTNQDWDTLKEIYASTNPFVTALTLALILCPVFVILSEINRNYSQVDRVWSILPFVYNAHYAIWARLAGLPASRLDSVALFTLFWSVRLTFNYWRKGGYKIGSEDYRWGILRSYINSRFRFFVFNVLFIGLTQSLLLCFITAPTYLFVVLAQLPDEGATFGIPDLVFSRLLIFFVCIETIADEQQWRFQRAKQTYQKENRVPDGFAVEDLERGFVVSGLWSFCRHPNFAAEQAIWLTLYLWASYVTQTPLNWAGVGALGYLLLFQGSTWLTESISASKYPEYREYQARVGRFIPRFSVEPKKTRKDKSKKKDT